MKTSLASIIWAMFGAVLMMASFSSPILSPLMLVCLVPLVYALDTCDLKGAALAGFYYGIVAYIFIPVSLLSWGWSIVIASTLIAGAFFSLFAVLVKSLSLLPYLRAPWVALPLGYALLQLLGERLFSIPILLSVAFPVEWLDGSVWFAHLGGRGADTLICAINGLASAIILGRNKIPAVISLSTALGIAGWINFPSERAFDDTNAEQALTVITVDNAISYERASSIPYSLSKRSLISKEIDSLTTQAISQTPDLIVWPEGGNGLANSQISSRREVFRQMADKGSYQLLAGSKVYHSTGRESNVAEYIVDGTIVDTAFKQQRVPLLETELQVGQNKVLDVKDSRVGVSICFDIAFPNQINRMIDTGAQALVVLSNDASFGYSLLTYIHLRYAAIRAMEQSRSVLFLSNTGPSVVISENGRILSGYIHNDAPRLESHRLPLQGQQTFYHRHGLWVNWVLLLFVTFCLMGINRWCRQ